MADFMWDYCSAYANGPVNDNGRNWYFVLNLSEERTILLGAVSTRVINQEADEEERRFRRENPDTPPNMMIANCGDEPLARRVRMFLPSWKRTYRPPDDNGE